MATPDILYHTCSLIDRQGLTAIVSSDLAIFDTWPGRLLRKVRREVYYLEEIRQIIDKGFESVIRDQREYVE